MFGIVEKVEHYGIEKISDPLTLQLHTYIQGKTMEPKLCYDAGMH